MGFAGAIGKGVSFNETSGENWGSTVGLIHIQKKVHFVNGEGEAH